MKVTLVCNVILGLLMLSVPAIADEQPPPVVLWTHTYGGINNERGFSVEETSDGGFILLGETLSYGNGLYDFWLVKTDSNGDELWDKTYGWTRDEIGLSVKETPDGDFVLLGGSDSYGYGYRDMWLVKTDSEGNELWNKTYGGFDWDMGYSLDLTSDGGYILLGDTENYGVDQNDMLLIKTDSEGNEQWHAYYGGIGSQKGNCVKETSDGGFILLGIIGLDIWLLKTDSEGHELWNKVFKGIGVDYGSSVIETSDGEFVLLGYTSSYGNGSYDMWLIKTDSNGNEIWDKTFGGSDADYGNSVKETSDGGYILLGYTYSFGAGGSDLWLIKTDCNGNEIWNNIIGGSEDDLGRSVVISSDDSYILFGDTGSYGEGESDFWLLKVNYYSLPPFSLLSPADGSTIYSKPVEFDWESSADPHSAEGRYDFYLDTDSEFGNPIVVDGLQKSNYTYPGELVNGETYYWKVRSRNKIGLITWSDETWSFQTNLEQSKAKLLIAEANDGIIQAEGIDYDDYVQLTFDKYTEKPEIDASNIDDILRLSDGHTWLDEAGRIKEALWNDEGNELTIYLCTNFSPPTVAPGDTITPYYFGISETPCIIAGSFDPSSVRKSNIPSGTPSELTLYPNRPNPFNPVTTITMRVPKEGHIIVSIFDLRGRLVEKLYDGVQPAGTAVFEWNANGLASGVYLCRVEMPDSGAIRTGKMMLLK